MVEKQRGGGPPPQETTPDVETLEKRRSQLYREYRRVWEANRKEPSVRASEKQAELERQIQEIESQIQGLATGWRFDPELSWPNLRLFSRGPQDQPLPPSQQPPIDPDRPLQRERINLPPVTALGGRALTPRPSARLQGERPLPPGMGEEQFYQGGLRDLTRVETADLANQYQALITQLEELENEPTIMTPQNREDLRAENRQKATEITAELARIRKQLQQRPGPQRGGPLTPEVPEVSSDAAWFTAINLNPVQQAEAVSAVRNFTAAMLDKDPSDIEDGEFKLYHDNIVGALADAGLDLTGDEFMAFLWLMENGDQLENPQFLADLRDGQGEFQGVAENILTGLQQAASNTAWLRVASDVHGAALTEATDKSYMPDRVGPPSQESIQKSLSDALYKAGKNWADLGISKDDYLRWLGQEVKRIQDEISLTTIPQGTSQLEAQWDIVDDAVAGVLQEVRMNGLRNTVESIYLDNPDPRVRQGYYRRKAIEMGLINENSSPITLDALSRAIQEIDRRMEFAGPDTNRQDIIDNVLNNFEQQYNVLVPPTAPGIPTAEQNKQAYDALKAKREEGEEELAKLRVEQDIWQSRLDALPDQESTEANKILTRLNTIQARMNVINQDRPTAKDIMDTVYGIAPYETTPAEADQARMMQDAGIATDIDVGQAMASGDRDALIQVLKDKGLYYASEEEQQMDIDASEAGEPIDPAESISGLAAMLLTQQEKQKTFAMGQGAYVQEPYIPPPPPDIRLYTPRDGVNVGFQDLPPEGTPGTVVYNEEGTPMVSYEDIVKEETQRLKLAQEVIDDRARQLGVNPDEYTPGDDPDMDAAFKAFDDIASGYLEAEKSLAKARADIAQDEDLGAKAPHEIDLTPPPPAPEMQQFTIRRRGGRRGY